MFHRFRRISDFHALRAGIRTSGKKRDPGNCEIYVSVYFNENQEMVMFDITIVIVNYERFAPLENSLPLGEYFLINNEISDGRTDDKDSHVRNRFSSFLFFC